MHRCIFAITVHEDSIYYELTHTELILEYVSSEIYLLYARALYLFQVYSSKYIVDAYCAHASEFQYNVYIAMYAM